MRVLTILLAILVPGGALAQADKLPDIADRLIEDTQDICVSRCCVINKKLICIEPPNDPSDPLGPVLMTGGRNGLPLSVEAMKQFLNEANGVNR